MLEVAVQPEEVEYLLWNGVSKLMHDTCKRLPGDGEKKKRHSALRLVPTRRSCMAAVHCAPGSALAYLRRLAAGTAHPTGCVDS